MHTNKTAKTLLFSLLLATQGVQAQTPVPPGTTVYGVTADGSLTWHRHLAALTGGGLYDAVSWDFTHINKEVGIGWNTTVGIFTTGKGIIYNIFPNGDLYWYRHDGYLTGAGLNDPGGWSSSSRKAVGRGWNGFKQVFSTGEGVIYGIKPDGSLRWYRHLAYQTGGGLNDPGSWDPKSGKEVGVGWNVFKTVFAAPGGVIYGVMPNGDLKWYKHTTYRTGGGLDVAGSWDANSGKVVGIGWNSLAQLFAGRDGVIYGVLPGGSLRWYRHTGYLTGKGLNDAGAWDPKSGKEIGTGWNYARLFGF